MKPVLPTAPKVTVGIPLYKSKRFLDIIIANIEAMPDDVEILISDRHCYDGAIDILAEKFAGDKRIRFFKFHDQIDWVGNINFLMGEATGKYWRFLAHDDTSPAGSLEKLISALDSKSGAILAYCPTKAIDLNDNLLPMNERLNPYPAHAIYGWIFSLILEMFWMGHFDGAFKGLVRRDILVRHNLFVRKTANNILPERCWLFGLCFLGSFEFVSDTFYIKRFYDDSTHRMWKIQGRHFLSAAYVLSSYLWDFVAPLSARLYGIWDLWLNARRYAHWQDSKSGHRPLYYAYPDPVLFFIEKGLLPNLKLFHSYVEKRQRKVDAIRELKLPMKK